MNQEVAVRKNGLLVILPLILGTDILAINIAEDHRMSDRTKQSINFYLAFVTYVRFLSKSVQLVVNKILPI